jgi:hypothetical protein
VHNSDGTITVSGNSTTNTLTLNTSGLQPTLTFTDSVVKTGTTVTLSNDTATPASSSYYGTNSSGVKGYYTLASLSANTALSNLTSPTAINQSLLFGTDNTFNIGAPSGASRPENIYVAQNVYAGVFPVSSSHPYIGIEAGQTNGATNVIAFNSGGTFTTNLTSDGESINVVNPGTGAKVLAVNAITSAMSNNDESTGVAIFSTDTNHNVSVGAAALATTATNGFLYIPTCAGTPTGTPTAKTGLAPMILDTTNGRFWMFYGGAWHFTVMT